MKRLCVVRGARCVVLCALCFLYSLFPIPYSLPASAATTTGVVSNASAPWRGWQRDGLGWDDERLDFVGTNLVSAADSLGALAAMDSVDAILAEAQTQVSNVEARASALAAEEGERPVILLTADYAIEDAIDRNNLTFVVADYTYNTNSRVVTAQVFSNVVLASAPIMSARITDALTGRVTSVPCNWVNYGALNASTNVTVRGEEFECYTLTYTLPEEFSATSVDFTRWGLVGDPATGFDIGNRQIRINGEMTYTDGGTNLFASILSVGTVTGWDDDGNPIDLSMLDFFTDNGLTMATVNTNAVEEVNE